MSSGRDVTSFAIAQPNGTEVTDALASGRDASRPDPLSREEPTSGSANRVAGNGLHRGPTDRSRDRAARRRSFFVCRLQQRVGLGRLVAGGLRNGIPNWPERGADTGVLSGRCRTDVSGMRTRSGRPTGLPKDPKSKGRWTQCGFDCVALLRTQPCRPPRAFSIDQAGEIPGGSIAEPS